MTCSCRSFDIYITIMEADILQCVKCAEIVHKNRRGRYPKHCSECDAEIVLPAMLDLKSVDEAISSSASTLDMPSNSRELNNGMLTTFATVPGPLNAQTQLAVVPGELQICPTCKTNRKKNQKGVFAPYCTSCKYCFRDAAGK